MSLDYRDKAERRNGELRGNEDLPGVRREVVGLSADHVYHNAIIALQPGEVTRVHDEVLAHRRRREQAGKLAGLVQIESESPATEQTTVAPVFEIGTRHAIDQWAQNESVADARAYVDNLYNDNTAEVIRYDDAA